LINEYLSREEAKGKAQSLPNSFPASGVLRISLPYSTYGLDVLAFIGWQHEYEHQQLVVRYRSS